jgi:hypothetical protein
MRRLPRKGEQFPEPGQCRHPASCRFSTAPCRPLWRRRTRFSSSALVMPAFLIGAPFAILAIAAAQPYALCFGSLQVGIDAPDNHRAFEFGEHAAHLEHGTPAPASAGRDRSRGPSGSPGEPPIEFRSFKYTASQCFCWFPCSYLHTKPGRRGGNARWRNRSSSPVFDRLCTTWARETSRAVLSFLVIISPCNR